MTNALKYLTFQATHRKQVIFLMTSITMLYLVNFHVNDIWTPNESFYAESVREMFESGNFLDIRYNYEPRYNKPPLTYWVIALSSWLFGINEFAIRLPIVLMALGAIWLTYLLGKQLFGDKGGIYAMVMMALSLQLIAVKQYASPEVPLTFFFTLTMYWFIKGYLEQQFKYILLAYVVLGLAVLTKGYPYILVIGGGIGLFIIIDTSFKIGETWKKIRFLKLHMGIPIILIIGLSWVIYMYMKDGQDFWTVYKRETIDRALTKKSNGLKPFFYLEVILWSILPYSLVFYYALIFHIKRLKNIKTIAFPFSWFLVMLVLFTFAKGKIPTYFIQAHPAMVLMIVPLLLNYKPSNRNWRVLWKITFLFPSFLLLTAGFGLLYIFELHPLWYLLPVSLIGVWVTLYLKRKTLNEYSSLVAIPFWSLYTLLLLFSIYLPRMEKFRPYDEIGRVINEQKQINPRTPILIQETLIHNIPFYAKRFADRDYTPEMINKNTGKTLALVRSENLSELEGFESLWSGWIYDFASESQFAKFIKACINAEKGDYSAFATYHLVYRD